MTFAKIYSKFGISRYFHTFCTYAEDSILPKPNFNAFIESLDWITFEHFVASIPIGLSLANRVQKHTHTSTFKNP